MLDWKFDCFCNIWSFRVSRNAVLRAFRWKISRGCWAIFSAFHIELPNVNLWDYFIAGKERQRKNYIIERYVTTKWIEIRVECASTLRNCPILRNSITRLLDTTFSISRHVNKRFKFAQSIIFFTAEPFGTIIFVEVNLNESWNVRCQISNFNIAFTLIFLNLFSCKIYYARECAAAFPRSSDITGFYDSIRYIIDVVGMYDDLSYNDAFIAHR